MGQRPDPTNTQRAAGAPRPSVLSPLARILAGMGTTTIPDWVTRTSGDVAEQFAAIGRARSAGRERYEAMLAALDWALYGGGAPISGTSWPSTGGSARVECDAALFVAHCGHAPSAAQWQSLGNQHPPRYTAGDTAEWGYGVYRVLSWLLGDTPAVPPTEDVSLWPGRLPEAQLLEVGAAVAARWG